MVHIPFTKIRHGETNLVGIGFLTVVCLLVLVALCLPKLEFAPRPQTWTSQAKLVIGWVPVHDACFTEKLSSLEVTINETLESAELRKRAKDRMKVLHPDLSPKEVKIRATRDKEPTIFNVFATGEEPKYIQIFLDALLDEFVDFRQQIYDQQHPENGIIGASASAIMERASDTYKDNAGRYPIWKLWTDAPPSSP